MCHGRTLVAAKRNPQHDSQFSTFRSSKRDLGTVSVAQQQPKQDTQCSTFRFSERHRELLAVPTTQQQIGGTFA